MQRYSDEGIVNVGRGKDLSIAELAHMIGDIVGFAVRLEFDPSKPVKGE